MEDREKLAAVRGKVSGRVGRWRTCEAQYGDVMTCRAWCEQASRVFDKQVLCGTDRYSTARVMPAPVAVSRVHLPGGARVSAGLQPPLTPFALRGLIKCIFRTPAAKCSPRVGFLHCHACRKML